MTDKGVCLQDIQTLIQCNIKKQITQSKIGRRPKQTFLQLRHTNDQNHTKRCSTLLIIIKMQIKTTVRYHFTWFRMTIKKSTYNKCWSGCGEKGTLLYCWWWCKVVQPFWRTEWRFLNKTKNRVTIWSSNSTPEHIFKTMKIKEDICTLVFTVDYLTIAKTRKQLKCPLTEEWIKRMWCIHMQWNITQP